MNRILNENDQIRNMLGKIRTMLNEVVVSDDETQDVTMDTVNTNASNDKNGEKIVFDEINTVGFLKSRNQLDDMTKDNITKAVGSFIKGTGLILDTLNVFVDEGQVVLSTETVRNPGANFISSITFDTNEENPQISIIPESIELNDDVINLLQTINISYKDREIGRDVLIQSTQSSGIGM